MIEYNINIKKEEKIMQEKELIEDVIKTELNYRHLLHFDQKSIFGIEIEMEEIDYNNTERLIKNKLDDSWEIMEDLSLLYGGLEIVSPPLTNRKETWNLLFKLSKTLKYINPTFQNASFQVNLDVPFQEDKLVPFLKFFSYYEDILFRLSRGFDFHIRNSALTYALPITPELVRMIRCNNSNEMICSCFDSKRYAIRLKMNQNHLMNRGEILHRKSTIPVSVIEFRTPNGTNDALLWQNYINTFYHILQYIASALFDYERLEYNLFHATYRSCINDYEILHIEKAIEFANLIFKEDIDKIYFLKQYIGIDYGKVKTK